MKLDLDGSIRPTFDKSGVPSCEERCPSFDGKRCMVMGHRPQSICEPAVVEMAALIRKLQREAPKQGDCNHVVYDAQCKVDRRG